MPYTLRSSSSLIPLAACLALAAGFLHAQPPSSDGQRVKINLPDTPVALAAGSFHGGSRSEWDFLADLAVANFESVSIIDAPSLKNSTSTLTGSAAGFTVRSLVAGDFNQDGKQDLALVGDATFGTVLLLGNGKGTFSANPVSTDSGYSITSADFNHDGIPDLAIAGNLGASANASYGDQVGGVTVEVLLGAGTGSFAGGSTTAFTIYSPSTHQLTYSGLPYALAAGDFNHDGNEDLAVTDAVSNTVVVLLGNGDGTFTTGGTFPVGSSPLALVAGDFNHDGKLDLAVANTTANTVTVLLGDGKGNFAPHGSPINVGALPQGIAVVELEGDGVLSLATANYVDGVHGTVTILHGRGDGSFWRQKDIAVGGGPVALVSGNFTDPGSRGAKDLAVANHSGYVQILRGAL